MGRTLRRVLGVVGSACLIALAPLSTQAETSSWSVVPSPNSGRTAPGFVPLYNVLTDVSCINASDCWAVGYASFFGLAKTLIEHYDGDAWTVVTSPNPVATFVLLSDVSCRETDDCWAVGNYQLKGSYARYTLIEHFDGSSWSVVPSANVTDSHAVFNFLNGVTCLAAADCWAAGSWSTNTAAGGTGASLVEHYDGAAWSIVSTPRRGFFSELNSIACSRPSDCWAVGDAYLGLLSMAGPSYQSLLAHYDGQQWTLAASPDPIGSSFIALHDVACSGRSSCWAVGSLATKTRPGSQAVLQRWNGRSWSVQATPGLPGLNSISCLGRSDCWAVGATFAHFNGKAWTKVSTPIGALGGVSCIDSFDCWAVGSVPAIPSGNPITLVEHFGPG